MCDTYPIMTSTFKTCNINYELIETEVDFGKAKGFRQCDIFVQICLCVFSQHCDSSGFRQCDSLPYVHINIPYTTVHAQNRNRSREKKNQKISFSDKLFKLLQYKQRYSKEAPFFSESNTISQLESQKSIYLVKTESYVILIL